MRRFPAIHPPAAAKPVAAGLDGPMALSVTTETIRAAAATDAYQDGRRLRDSAAVAHLESGYGGLNADVTDGDQLRRSGSASTTAC